jgi:hypothetical protein
LAEEVAMSFEINEAKAAEWINGWRDSFDTVAADPTSVKTLIYLTLLERGEEMSSYQDITDELKRREVIKGEVTKDDMISFRNGMNQIVNALKTHSLYDIESRKSGRVSSYRLKGRDRSAARNNGAGGGAVGRIVKVLEDPELTATTDFEYVAKRLIIDRVMPFYGIYLPMTAASRWVLYSEGEATKDRSNYEGDECIRLLDDWFSKFDGAEVSVIGLGVGEGLGEIEIIERLLGKKEGNGELKEYNFSRIHYCAIDTNVHLLMDHAERLKHKFKKEIESNKLLCGVACGNFLEDFLKIIQRMRDAFASTGQLDPGQVFLPDTGTLVSILGNVVGNAEKAKEWSYFEPVMNGLQGFDLAFLIGVSVPQPEQGKPEGYEDLEDLLLATPRYLTHELAMLKTGQVEDDPGKKDEPEFVLPKGKAKKDERWPEARKATYEGAGTNLIEGAQVRGEIYEFYYITKWELSMESEGKRLSMQKGSPLLLHNIIKFDKDTLIKFLQSKGLYPSRQRPDPDDISSGDQNRRYVVLGMTSMQPA